MQIVYVLLWSLCVAFLIVFPSIFLNFLLPPTNFYNGLIIPCVSMVFKPTEIFIALSDLRTTLFAKGLQIV